MSRSSSDGVIHLTPGLFDQYAIGKRRPYTLIIFLTASHLMDKQALNLRGLRKEFGLLTTVCSSSTYTHTDSVVLEDGGHQVPQQRNVEVTKQRVMEILSTIWCGLRRHCESQGRQACFLLTWNSRKAKQCSIGWASHHCLGLFTLALMSQWGWTVSSSSNTMMWYVFMQYVCW